MVTWQPRFIVDIGACVGLFVDHCLENYPVEHVFAFEPLPANYDHLVTKYANESRVSIYPLAVSNFSGTAQFFKKPYRKKLLGVIPWRHYDFAGNAGSSLKREKSNVSSRQFSAVEVLRARDLFGKIGRDHIDLLKIDSEGSEYDVLADLPDQALTQQIERLYFEDHTRKIPHLAQPRADFFARVAQLGIEDKVFLQGDHLDYTSLTHSAHQAS